MGRLLGGIALIGIAGFMLLGFVASDQTPSATVTALTLAITVALPAATGGYLLRQHFRKSTTLSKKQDQLRRETWEAEILRLAEDHGGKLTVVEATRALAIGSEEVAKTLEGMALRGLAEIEVTDQGLLVYSFPDLPRLAGKRSARKILDV
jgi:hypothetical protein